jgi:hypothetical protein
MTGETLASLMLLLPVAWTVTHLVWSRVHERLGGRAQSRGDMAAASHHAERSRNLQDISRLMPDVLLLVFAAGVVIRVVQLLSGSGG